MMTWFLVIKIQAYDLNFLSYNFCHGSIQKTNSKIPIAISLLFLFSWFRILKFVSFNDETCSAFLFSVFIFAFFQFLDYFPSPLSHASLLSTFSLVSSLFTFSLYFSCYFHSLLSTLVFTLLPLHFHSLLCLSTFSLNFLFICYFSLSNFSVSIFFLSLIAFTPYPFSCTIFSSFSFHCLILFFLFIFFSISSLHFVPPYFRFIFQVQLLLI